MSLTPKQEAQRRFYVYHLIDPRNGEVFYVGKGTGRRMRHHVREARGRKFGNARKCERILAIMDAGLEVIEQIVLCGLTETAAFALEAAEIERIGVESLTNLSHGLEPALVKDKKRAERFIQDMLWFLERVADEQKAAVRELIAEMRENVSVIDAMIAGGR